MVTLQAYLWSHYNLAILLFFVISTTVKTYLLGKSVAVLFNTPQFISYNAKGADIKLPECTFNTLYTSYTLYTCLQNLVYRSPTIRMLLPKALYTLYTHYTLYTCQILSHFLRRDLVYLVYFVYLVYLSTKLSI